MNILLFTKFETEKFILIINCCWNSCSWKNIRAKFAQSKATIVRCKHIKSTDISWVYIELLYNESKFCKIMQ